MSKFGPSGSLKNENIALEHAIDVIPKIINEVFFDSKYIFVIILENLRAGCLTCTGLVEVYEVRTHFSVKDIRQI